MLYGWQSGSGYKMKYNLGRNLGTQGACGLARPWNAQGGKDTIANFLDTELAFELQFVKEILELAT